MIKKVFISYSDADKNKVHSIANRLKATNIFLPIVVADKRQALVHLTDKVQSGIIECDYFLPILTRKSIRTQWINQEIGFASAKEKIIIPVVEKQVVRGLKGFIHKQVDLPYTFEGNSQNGRSEANKYTRIISVLINDLCIQNKENPIYITIESLFPGKWESEFYLNDQKINEKEIEIKEKNKYFVNGVHWFNLKDIYIDIKNKKLKFKKEGLRKDGRQIINDLKIIELGKKYEGTEIDNVVNRDIKITYHRIN